jgi:hypothetical protein
LLALASTEWRPVLVIERVYMHASVCSASRGSHRLHRLIRHHQPVPCIANARRLAAAASRITPCVELSTSPPSGVTATAAVGASSHAPRRDHIAIVVDARPYHYNTSGCIRNLPHKQAEAHDHARDTVSTLITPVLARRSYRRELSG